MPVPTSTGRDSTSCSAGWTCSTTRRSARSCGWRSPRSAAADRTPGSTLPEPVLQARSGCLATHGHMTAPPLTVAGELGEYVTGAFAALGAATAWYRASRTGVAGDRRRVEARGDARHALHGADAHGALPRRPYGELPVRDDPRERAVRRRELRGDHDRHDPAVARAPAGDRPGGPVRRRRARHVPRSLHARRGGARGSPRVHARAHGRGGGRGVHRGPSAGRGRRQRRVAPTVRAAAGPGHVRDPTRGVVDPSAGAVPLLRRPRSRAAPALALRRRNGGSRHGERDQIAEIGGGEVGRRRTAVRGAPGGRLHRVLVRAVLDRVAVLDGRRGRQGRVGATPRRAALQRDGAPEGGPALLRDVGAVARHQPGQAGDHARSRRSPTGSRWRSA